MAPYRQRRPLPLTRVPADVPTSPEQPGRRAQGSSGACLQLGRTREAWPFAPSGKIAIESAMTSTPATPDLLPLLDQLKADIDQFVSGFEPPKPAPVPAVVEAPATEAA